MTVIFDTMRQELLSVLVTVFCSFQGAAGIPLTISKAGHALPLPSLEVR